MTFYKSSEKRNLWIYFRKVLTTGFSSDNKCLKIKKLIVLLHSFLTANENRKGYFRNHLITISAFLLFYIFEKCRIQIN